MYLFVHTDTCIHVLLLERTIYATARTHLNVDTCVRITFCSVHSGVDDGNRSTPQAHNSS